MSYLRIRQMSHTSGGFRAVHNYNLEIRLVQIRGLIGTERRPPFSLPRTIVNRAVDIVRRNVCSVGGYTEAVKVAAMAMAQAFNLPMANGGGWPHHNRHLHAAMAKSYIR